jgi:glycosyltransferase involved in cell wall biosynthesis
LKIALICSHAWALPSAARTGDSAILLDLSRSLVELGHDVDLYAPPGTTPPEGVTLRPMPLEASRFEGKPSAAEAEEATLERYFDELKAADVVHDCSVGKLIHAAFPEKALATVWGGPWRHEHKPRNVVAQSHAQADRLKRGATDYENTDTPDAGGKPGAEIAEVRVVWNGIDTDVYKPSGRPKQDWFLMLGRWHPVRGVEQGIELAKATGINLLIAGTDPQEDHPAQAEYAAKIRSLIRGCDNIALEFLPPDPEHRARIVELYQDARALLFLPQFAEPFGLPQIEAMACGTPVLASYVGSVPEIVDQNVTGIAVRGGKLETALALFSAGHCTAITPEACRAHAVEHFDRRIMAANYAKLYAEVAAGGGWG